MDAAEPIPIVAPAPEAKPADVRTLEPGVGAFLLSGGALGAYAGGSAFVMSEVTDAVALRPSIAFGESLTSLHSVVALARFDTCVRVPGHYRSGDGIQLDLCGGLGAGFSYVSAGTVAGAPLTARTLPYIDIGPSVGLRGEVGRFAVTLRSIAGVDVARDGFADATGARIDPPLFTVRWELVFSWDVRGTRSDGR